MSHFIHAAPLAVTPDGTIFVSVAYLGCGISPEELLASTPTEGNVFIGVAVTEAEATVVRRRLDDAAADAAAHLGGARQRRRRARVRTSRKTES